MICFKPIGFFKTEASREEVKESFDGVEGYIEILEEYRDGLIGLSGFSHIFVISYLHEVPEESRATLIVRPKRFLRLGLEAPEVGVFATDSPHRPNPIGLHLVRVKGISEGRIYISNMDAYDGTPVLDIKPYTLSRIVRNPSFPKWYSELIEKRGVE